MEQNQAYFVLNTPHIASWVENLNEDVTIEQALADWSVVQVRPEEFTEEITSSIVIAILNRFCLPSYSDLEYIYTKWQATGKVD